MNNEVSTPTIEAVSDREGWRNVLSRRTSRAAVHVLVTAVDEEEAAELIKSLCGSSEVYGIYVFSTATDAIPPDLENCIPPVFVVSDKEEAQLFAERLVAGDFSVLDHALNGEEMLYRYLGAFPS